MSEKLLPISITSGYRPIRNGDRYDHLFPVPDDKDKIIIRDGDVDETIELMKSVAWKYKDDTSGLAPQLKGDSHKETCENIWNFLYNHIQYRLDKRGLEQLRRPARSWQERKEGIDCDCFSIFVSTILLNLNIPHTFRITKYDQDSWQHVYVVAPIPRSGSYYTIDCVLSQFNYEKPYNQKKDYTMSITNDPAHLAGIDIAVLSGLGAGNTLTDVVFARDLEGIENIGSTSEEERLKAMKSYLEKTRRLISSNPKLITGVDYPPAFIEMLDYALKAWDTPNRDKAIENLARNEEEWNKKNGLSAVDENHDMAGLDDDWQELDNPDERPQLGKIRLKGFFKKVGEAIKKGGQFFMRFNPVSIAVRSAYLLAMKLDVGGMASKLKWGYATEEQAKKKGISREQWQKAKAALEKVEKLFADKLQGRRSKLRSAILKGKAKGIDGTSGLGIALAASVAAASPLIILTLKILSDTGLIHKDAATKVVSDLEAHAGKQPSKSDGSSDQPGTSEAGEETGTEKTNETTGKSSGIIKPLIIVGAAGLGIWGISSLMRGSKKKTALSGPEVNPEKAAKHHKKAKKSLDKILLK
jgi:hypothetical protein